MGMKFLIIYWTVGLNILIGSWHRLYASLSATMIAKDDALTLKRLGAGKSVGQNPLLLINKSPKTDQEIIVILKQANPELVNFLSTSIPENDSYTVSHNHSASRNNSANTFAFFPRQNTTQQINYEEKSPGLGN